MDAMKKYDEWLQSDYFDEEFIRELESIQGNTKEIEDRFYKFLDFGTAGMRGVIGAGTNRMNKYIVRKATQGFANYIKNAFDVEQPKIAIAYDCRNKSDLFAKEAALVMAANGIQAYLYDSLRTTPQLSFAVRTLGCQGGIMVTASHNPSEYNGYKVYDETGCQLVPDKGNKLIAEVNKIEDFSEINYISEEAAGELFQIIPPTIDDEFVENIKAMSINSHLIQSTDLKVVYSPLHGTGGEIIKRVLTEMGLKNLTLVEEQMQPDGNFTTVDIPNPEEEGAFELSLDYAKENDSELLICTDPDSDRMGVMIKAKDDYVSLNGNQIGTLLLDYILDAFDVLPPNGVVITSVVTSGIVEKIAKAYGVDHKIVLTGFKYIGEMMNKFEKTNEHFIFGFEESYGYLSGTHVRDKDAVVAAMLMVELAAYYKKNNKSILEKLDEIYQTYGYYKEEMISIKHAGKAGEEKIKNILKAFRTAEFDSMGDYKISQVIDYLNDETGLPTANVLKYYFEDGSWFAVRPSGTEPKIKLYFSINDTTEAKVIEKKEAIKSSVLNFVEKV